MQKADRVSVPRRTSKPGDPKTFVVLSGSWGICVLGFWKNGVALKEGRKEERKEGRREKKENRRK